MGLSINVLIYPSPIFIVVLVAPQILPMDFGEESVDSGEVASLTCTVHKGDLPIKITWLHNNESIRSDANIMVSKAGRKVSTLTIDSVQAEHAGTFTCLAQNHAGSSHYSVVLHVNGTTQVHINIIPLNLLPQLKHHALLE